MEILIAIFVGIGVQYWIVANGVREGGSVLLMKRHAKAQTELLALIAGRQGVPAEDIARIVESVDDKPKPKVLTAPAKKS